MSTPVTPPETSPPAGGSARGLFDRLSLGAKLVCGGAVLSVVAAFLRSFSVSSSASVDAGPLGKFATGGLHGGAMMIESWQGIMAVVGCVAAGVVVLLLYGSRPNPKSRELSFAMLGAAAVGVIFSLYILFSASNNASSFGGAGFSVSAGPGMGAYLMVVAAGLCAVGSVMHARDTRLF